MVAETEAIAAMGEKEEMQVAEEKMKDLELPEGKREVKEGTVMQNEEQKVTTQKVAIDTELLHSMNNKLDLLLAAQNVSEGV